MRLCTVLFRPNVISPSLGVTCHEVVTGFPPARIRTPVLCMKSQSVDNKDNLVRFSYRASHRRRREEGAVVDEKLGDGHCGFRPGRGATDPPSTTSSSSRAPGSCPSGVSLFHRPTEGVRSGTPRKPAGSLPVSFRGPRHRCVDR